MTALNGKDKNELKKSVKRQTRKAEQGDITEGQTLEEVKYNTVSERVMARLNKQATILEGHLETGNEKEAIEAAQNYLQNFSKEERLLILEILQKEYREEY
ncbi:MAG TPA: hypothetical protein PK715_11755, partial [Chitinophagales bacterium]|nr:hypothetical protein [Chitinophagales bacterium]